jgi:CDP-diacylglycerol--glycerol-3-phosphate 3-phosphatidyltransferase
MDNQADPGDAQPAQETATPHQPRFLTIPNVLTVSRVAIAPIFLAIFLLTDGPGDPDAPWDTPRIGLLACFILALLGEATDFFDGMMARRLNQVSDFGKLMDPYSDSVFRLTIYFCFASSAHGEWIPLWMVLIIFYRDILSSVIRVFAMHKGIVVSARASGKIKAWTQAGVYIALFILALTHDTTPAATAKIQHLGNYLMWIAVVISAISGIDYAYANRKVFIV